MSLKHSLFFFCIFALQIFVSEADQSYEDARCMCTCTIVNGTIRYKRSFISPVPPNNDCDAVVVTPPLISNENQTKELCPRCECNYESRNTTIIKVVVAIVIWIISLLVIYMFFLLCLDPLLNKRAKSSYVEHTNEEDDTSSIATGAAGITSSHPMAQRGNVLNRVGHQQDKWKRQVKEQRRNIYDKHTMLN